MTARAGDSAADVLELVGLDPVASIDDAAAHEWERERIERELRSFIALAGVPQRLVRRWRADECHELCARVLERVDTSDLVILAPRVDRAGAAGALLDHYLRALDTDRPAGGLWRSAREHVDLVMAGSAHDAHAERAQVRRAQITSLLVLDRVGVEHEKTAGIIDRLLVDRWEAERPTIACSWVSNKVWEQRYPETVAASSGLRRVIR